jgi:hypothetical protein
MSKADNEDIRPARDCKPYTSIVTDIDLTSAAESPVVRPCRQIYVVTDGDLVVTTASGQVRTLAVTAGMTVPIEATAIGSASTADIIVYW